MINLEKYNKFSNNVRDFDYIILIFKPQLIWQLICNYHIILFINVLLIFHEL